jgi:hypothetical protein
MECRGNSELRRLVTLRALLRSWDTDEGTGRLHIAHILDHFCREVYGLRSFEVLNPGTELPPEDVLAFPAEYFGPDALPVYEDGALKERSCSRTHHCPKRPTRVSKPEVSATYDWRKIGRAMGDRGWRRFFGQGVETMAPKCRTMPWLDLLTALHHYKGKPLGNLKAATQRQDHLGDAVQEG